MGLIRFLFSAAVVWFVWRLLDGLVGRSRDRRDRRDDFDRHDPPGGGSGRGGQGRGGRLREDKLGEYVDYEEVDR